MTTYKYQNIHSTTTFVRKLVLPPLTYNVGHILQSNDRWEQKAISYSLNSSASSNTQNIKTRRLMRLLLATAKRKQIKQVTVTWNVVCKLHCSFRMDRYRTSKPVTEFRNKSHSNARIISNLRPAPHLNPWHRTADNSLIWDETVKCFHLLLVRRTIRRQVNNTFLGDTVPLLIS